MCPRHSRRPAPKQRQATPPTEWCVRRSSRGQVEPRTVVGIPSCRTRLPHGPWVVHLLFPMRGRSPGIMGWPMGWHASGRVRSWLRRANQKLGLIRPNVERALAGLSDARPGLLGFAPLQYQGARLGAARSQREGRLDPGDQRLGLARVVDVQVGERLSLFHSLTNHR